MTSSQRFDDHDIIQRYTDQPSRLPDALRALVTTHGSETRQLVAYALSDLDSQLRFSRNWLALTSHELVLVRERANGNHDSFRARRDTLAKVELATGLSCHVLRVYGKTDAEDAPLFELRFTHRQRRSMEGLAFLLEQLTKGIALQAPDPDQSYLESVAQPIREAQALGSTRRLAVV